MREIKKVYGPYLNNEDREIVHIMYTDGSRRCIQLAKYLLEQHLGKELSSEETVDHINRDHHDHRIENLRILSRSEHSIDDARRIKLVEITCIYCGQKAQKDPKNLAHNKKLGRAGPFCGRICSGKYGAEIQNRRQEKLNNIYVDDREYYYLEKLPAPLAK